MLCVLQQIVQPLQNNAPPSHAQVYYLFCILFSPSLPNVNERVLSWLLKHRSVPTGHSFIKFERANYCYLMDINNLWCTFRFTIYVIEWHYFISHIEPMFWKHGYVTEYISYILFAVIFMSLFHVIFLLLPNVHHFAVYINNSDYNFGAGSILI